MEWTRRPGSTVTGPCGPQQHDPGVAYRADMDAVTSMVVGDQPYRSQVAGVKHVCGHDAHVAIGIGIARVLSQVRAELPGTVKFIFQPAEENATGAAAMIKDGVLEEDPKPQAIFGLHTVPWVNCLPPRSRSFGNPSLWRHAPDRFRARRND